MRQLCRPSIALLLALTLPLSWVAACGDDDTTDPGQNNDTSGPPRGLRVLWTLETPARVDLVLFDEANAQLRVDGIARNQATTHEPLAPGVYRLSFFEAGTSTPLDLNIANIAIEADTTLTLAVATGQNDAPDKSLLPDEIVLPGENQSRVRIVHLGQGPVIDVVDTANSGRLGDGLSFGQLAPYVNVDLGTYALEVREQAAGTSILLFDVPLRPAEVSTIFLVGDADPNDDGVFDDSTLEALHVVDYTFE